MAKKKIVQKFINEGERELAAKYFTLSNTAMLHCIRGKDLEQGYYQADGDMQMECGIGLSEELADWRNTIKEGNDYCFEEWEKVKKDYI
jgi:hypothetical protein